jgi:hypothetical protein
MEIKHIPEIYYAHILKLWSILTYNLRNSKIFKNACTANAPMFIFSTNVYCNPDKIVIYLPGNIGHLGQI